MNLHKYKRKGIYQAIQLENTITDNEGYEFAEADVGDCLLFPEIQLISKKKFEEMYGQWN